MKTINRQKHKGGRKPKKDPCKHRYAISLNDVDNARFLSLFEASGMEVKAHFITASLFEKPVKVVKIDKATVDYYMRLTSFYSQFRAIGVNYNQVTKAIKNNFSERKALAFLSQLEKATFELVAINKQIMDLTREFEERWLQKIGSGSSLYSVLAYNYNKVKEGQAKVLLVNNMVESPNGNFGIAICTNSFEPYLIANKRCENPIIHISLNPDPKDNLNEEQFSEIAQEYMQKLGYGNQPFIVYKHEDIDRHHLHIISVKVDETGKMIRDNFQHRLSMRICRELEKKHAIIPANEKQKSEGCGLKKVDIKKGNIKQQIANVVRPISRSWHFQTFNEYKALLSVYNVHVAEVKGEKQGKAFAGIVYSVLDDKGEVKGTPIKSSKIGKTVGRAALQKRMEKSKELIRNRKLKEGPKEIITKVFHNCKSQEDFEKQLIKNSISVLFRKNDSGRIYGVTFIDHKQKFVFNGSRLGKDFSANVFYEKFNQEGKATEELLSSVQKQFQTTSDPTSSIENLTGLMGIESRGENYEEEAFIRRIKRKKKRKRKL